MDWNIRIKKAGIRKYVKSDFGTEKGEKKEGSVRGFPKEGACNTVFLCFIRTDSIAMNRGKPTQDTEFSQSKHFFNTKIPYT